MATLTIRELDDAVYERLETQARANRRSVEAEARHVLGEHVRSFDTMLADLRRRQDKVRAEHGVQPDSLPGLRALRDEM